MLFPQRYSWFFGVVCVCVDNGNVHHFRNLMPCCCACAVAVFWSAHSMWASRLWKGREVRKVKSAILHSGLFHVERAWMCLMAAPDGGWRRIRVGTAHRRPDSTPLSLIEIYFWHTRPFQCGAPAIIKSESCFSCTACYQKRSLCFQSKPSTSAGSLRTWRANTKCN